MSSTVWSMVGLWWDGFWSISGRDRLTGVLSPSYTEFRDVAVRCHEQALLPIVDAKAVESVVTGQGAPMTWLALREAAVASIPIGEPKAELVRQSAGSCSRQIVTGITAYLTTASLTATPRSSQSTLSIGTPRGSTLGRRVLPSK